MTTSEKDELRADAGRDLTELRRSLRALLPAREQTQPDAGMSPAEQNAVKQDATTRLKELQAVEAELLLDASEPEVLSELVWVRGQIKQAMEAAA